MRKIIVKKGEEKIKIPLGVFINGFIIKAKSVIQYNQMNNQTNASKKEGE